MSNEYPDGYTPMTFHEKAQAWQAALESDDAVAFIERAVLDRLPKPDTAERDMLVAEIEDRVEYTVWLDNDTKALLRRIRAHLVGGGE